MPDQTCGNCRYGHGWTMTKHTPPRINVNQAGRCSYHIAEPVWPLSVAPQARVMPRKSAVWANESDCPCWEGK